MKVLLMNPPVCDYRLEWAKWHQPIGLLQIGAMLRSKGIDVKLLDCLHTSSKQITRKKLGTEVISGFKFHKWRFGIPENDVRRKLKEIKSNWLPDMVFITSLNSVWWEGVRDTVKVVQEIFPETPVYCGGVYPSAFPEHANQHIPIPPNNFFRDEVKLVQSFQPDLSLYDKPPKNAGLLFYDYSSSATSPSPRPANEIVDEITDKARLGVTNFAFFDEEIDPQHHDEFCTLLDSLSEIKLKNRRITLIGNISPKIVTQEIAQRLRRGYVKEVFFRCNLDFTNPTKIQYADTIEDYEKATRLLEQNDFSSRTGDVTAMLVAGLPYENLAELTERTIKLAHSVGSVIIVPYQYHPLQDNHPLIQRALSQNGHFTPERWNSKLFPLAQLSGNKLDDYIELLRLTRLLNSKYRSVTFDFLGDSFTAELFRQSIYSEGYNPLEGSEEITKIDLRVVQHDH